MNVTGRSTINVEITDNSEEYRRMLADRLKIIAQSVGRQAEMHAKEQCPVDTGRLRNSITYATEGHESFTHNYEDNEGNAYSYNVGATSEKGDVYIGTNVEYAEEQETNGAIPHRVGNAHFLRNAATNHNDEYKNIVRAGLDY